MFRPQSLRLALALSTVLGAASLTACDSAHWSTPVTGLTGMMLSVWGSSPKDVWVVGGTGTDASNQTSQVTRFDGTLWSTVTTVPQTVLWWIHGFAGGPRWIAGDNAVILRGDQGGFTQITTDTPGVVFYGIWGATDGDMWAVGGKLGAFSTIVRGDMSGMHEVTSAPKIRGGGTWFKVWGSAANDVWFVGDGASLAHWDGAAFTSVDVSGAGIASNDRLTTVAGRSASDVYIVGGLTLGARALHYDGTDWKPLTGNGLDLSRAGVLTGVSVAPSGDAFITGLGGTKLRFKDSTWIDDSLLDPLADLHGVFAFSADEAFVAGGSFATLAHGIVAHWGGQIPTVSGQ